MKVKLRKTDEKLNHCHDKWWFWNCILAGLLPLLSTQTVCLRALKAWKCNLSVILRQQTDHKWKWRKALVTKIVSLVYGYSICICICRHTWYPKNVIYPFHFSLKGTTLISQQKNNLFIFCRWPSFKKPPMKLNC